VAGRRGGLGYLYAGFAVLSLMRWSLLKGLPPPGEDELVYVHVVCPRRCGNDWWETDYRPQTVKSCGRHKDGRVAMVECEECAANPGHHRRS
jgi:hypothetical protein